MEIHELKTEDYGEIAKLIAIDPNLQDEFGFATDTVPTANQLEIDYTNWKNSRNAKMFGIRVDDAMIGQITLSRLDLKHKTARVGYWIASEFRGLGFGSQALSEIISLSREMGLKYIFASVAHDNQSSRNLLKKFGGKIIDQNKTNFEYELRLGS